MHTNQAHLPVNFVSQSKGTPCLIYMETYNRNIRPKCKTGERIGKRVKNRVKRNGGTVFFTPKKSGNCCQN